MTQIVSHHNPSHITDQDNIDHDPNARQALAADPTASVWVSASAGTGKTKILTDRVLRLMLPREGQDSPSATPPDKILCLTYTKTAASEMADRIHKRLSEWAVMEDQELSDYLSDLTQSSHISQDTMNTARSLFAKVVDLPGGMKIMTIHSFCQSVLKRFPLEAGLPAHFDVLDERSTQDYLMRAQKRLIQTVRAEPDSDLGIAFQTLSTQVNADQFSDLIQDIANHRQTIKKLMQRYEEYSDLKQAILQHMGCAAEDTVQSVTHAACQDSAFAHQALREMIAPLVESSTKTDQTIGQALEAFLTAEPDHRPSLIDGYCQAFLTKADGTIRKKLCSKGITKAYPHCEDLLFSEAERLYDLKENLKSLYIADFTYKILIIGHHIVTHYEEIKNSNVQLDYDDLIFYTERLLSNTNQASWILYKMDQGIDHILVDEAQDTSPAQWTIIRTLAEEFFSGHSARDHVQRTIFVVGDEKQSIFSFQGADPQGFQRMRQHFQSYVTEAEQKFTPVNLQMSFRSTPAVLGAVDHIYTDPSIHQGVQNHQVDPIKHLPFRKGQAGLIEVWPLIPGQGKADHIPWSAPIQPVSVETAQARLALKIAETISDWLHRGEMLPAKNRKIHAGDIMILFRRRSALFDQIVRALKHYNVPISGVDRLVLTDHLAVQDCLIAAECALFPEDDLSLASFLKSPFIGYDEEKLFHLAYNRPSSLWQALKQFDPKTYDYIQGLSQDVRHQNPYMFFQNLLITQTADKTQTGRKALFSRLGLEIEDAVDEFLNICIDFERLHTPHMQSFLHWFRQGQSEVKREQEGSEHKHVRLMTVHASKGLQAPIVFLPDTTMLPQNKFQILWPDDDDQFPLWVPRKEYRNDLYKDDLANKTMRQSEEYRRLLYVALTRAEDRLYICGAQSTKKCPPGSWYDLCARMMQSMPDIQNINFTLGDTPITDPQTGEVKQALQYTSAQTTAHSDDTKQGKTQKPTRPLNPVPDWAYTTPMDDPLPPKPLAPSRPSDPDPAIRSPLMADDHYRFARGNLIHQILEILPQISPDKQRQTCAHYLAQPAHDLTSAQQSELCDEILNVIHHPEFGVIFGPNSRAEVPIVGLINKQDQQDFYALSGQIDRMVVEDHRILIIDYKTNRPPPAHHDDVPDIYWRQMAIYQSALEKTYPGKTIESALLWTDGPRLMPLPNDILQTYQNGQK